ncbi:hypothetical protein L873DRAFT_707894 [Choiromyces venosus 120613-1]|uniref:Uncharacterized protein n=1 Tax=Choiromyces venosus 120613-1 TaxID=1336337 RepID=A0A3N4ITA9_9PEZI|nr:hypothetical protein L873DRAFT_707894 [Choiromyces venosus 120613-1]
MTTLLFQVYKVRQEVKEQLFQVNKPNISLPVPVNGFITLYIPTISKYPALMHPSIIAHSPHSPYKLPNISHPLTYFVMNCNCIASTINRTIITLYCKSVVLYYLLLPATCITVTYLYHIIPSCDHSKPKKDVKEKEKSR